MENYSLSDIRAVTDGDGMFGGNGFLFILALLFLPMLFRGGYGGYGGYDGGRPATTEDLATGFNFNALQGKTNDILAAVNNNNQVLGNAICQLGYQDLQNFNALERQLAACCCDIQRSIDSVKFDMANYAAATNATTVSTGQKILDKLCSMEIAQKDAVIAQQNQRIGQLELNAALCGVVRYPTMTTYATTCNPFFGTVPTGCNCANV